MGAGPFPPHDSLRGETKEGGKFRPDTHCEYGHGSHACHFCLGDFPSGPTQYPSAVWEQTLRIFVDAAWQHSRISVPPSGIPAISWLFVDRCHHCGGGRASRGQFLRYEPKPWLARAHARNRRRGSQVNCDEPRANIWTKMIFGLTDSDLVVAAKTD